MPTPDDNNYRGRTHLQVCFRPVGDLADRIDYYTQTHGITKSELTRAALIVYLGADPNYQAIKEQAYSMFRRILGKLDAELPDTHEEAIARGYLDP